MEINEDLSKPVIIHGSRQDWVASPSPGVDRRMLFRIGEEKARATSLVRYAPGSSFARHVHTGGEEFLVLDGTFQDEEGDYPAGRMSAIRRARPMLPQPRTAPRSLFGCGNSAPRME